MQMNSGYEKFSMSKRAVDFYLEWSGTRKHPKATKKILTNVNIEEKGSFYYVTDDNGIPLNDLR